MSPETRHHQNLPGLQFASLERREIRELHVTVHPLPGEGLGRMLERLGEILRENGAAVVRHSVFGTGSARERTVRALESLMGRVDWPISWIEGDESRPGNNGSADAIAGMQVMAVSGAPVESVMLDGRVVGRLFSDGWARHFLAGDLTPPDTSLPRPEQARRAFEMLAAALARAGMSMRDVARTWLYLDDLLSWYKPFNEVRAVFFREQGVLRGRLPASTGIRGRNPSGSAILAGAWAVQPLGGSVAIREVPSPLQCAAPKYGSCFSRAVEIEAPDLRRVLVSGTASIARDGGSARPGDPRGQVDLTMEVVGAILSSRGLGFEDVTRAITYFKRIEDTEFFDAWLADRGIDFFPTISLQTDVCRDELLFEVELDAAAGTSGRPA